MFRELMRKAIQSLSNLGLRLKAISFSKRQRLSGNLMSKMG